MTIAPSPLQESFDGLTSSRGFVAADRVQLHYVESGGGSSLLFVPGWMATIDFWERQLRHFASRYRVASFDPRSQGDSTKIDGGNCATRRAQDLHTLIETLGLAPVVIVAWSMGVTDVLSFLDQFGPSGVRAIVLVDGPIVSLARSPNVWAALAEEIRKMALDRDAQNAALVRRFLKRPHSEALLRRLEAGIAKTPTDAAIALAFDALQFDFEDVLRRTDVPMMFVGRAGDPGGQAAIFDQNRPTDRIEMRGDVGHALFLDDPDWFNAIVDDFLESLPAGEAYEHD